MGICPLLFASTYPPLTAQRHYHTCLFIHSQRNRIIHRTCTQHCIGTAGTHHQPCSSYIATTRSISAYDDAGGCMAQNVSIVPMLPVPDHRLSHHGPMQFPNSHDHTRAGLTTRRTCREYSTNTRNRRTFLYCTQRMEISIERETPTVSQQRASSARRLRY